MRIARISALALLVAVAGAQVIKGLPGGLTEKAMEAARQIKFIPAMKDGKPVSMWMNFEYKFSLF